MQRDSAGAAELTEQYMDGVVARSPGQPEFHQTVRELLDSVVPLVAARSDYRDARVVERLTEPDRIVIFRVVWEDDAGELHVERGYRVQFSNLLGPYKGGLRFHPTVNLSVLKFLGFEQCFKNALTGLPMGGAKGGATFDPHGRSDREVMRFCQAFMTELYRHIGEDVDVPAGDIGVGSREIGYLWGQYKRIANRVTGVLTGKRVGFGGSAVRTEATGYGAVYFAQEMLAHIGDSLDAKSCLVSGSGNVALYTAEKLLEVGARVLTLSDSGGTLHVPHGISVELLHELKLLKEVRRGRLAELADEPGIDYRAGRTPWDLTADVAFPSATQNELDAEDAKALAGNGCRMVVEGANMPATLDATHVLRAAGVRFAPGKAANAGGVAVSGLEQSQNAQRLSWPADEIDRRLRAIMTDIHAQCVHYGAARDDHVDYVIGANRAGFLRVAEALVAHGVG